MTLTLHSDTVTVNVGTALLGILFLLSFRNVLMEVGVTADRCQGEMKHNVQNCEVMKRINQVI